MKDYNMVDKKFDALGHVQRRRLLFSLLHNNQQELSKIPNVPWEITETEVEQLHTYHVHAPKLAEYGYIEWDREADVATKGPQFDEIRPLLELLGERQPGVLR